MDTAGVLHMLDELESDFDDTDDDPDYKSSGDEETSSDDDTPKRKPRSPMKKRRITLRDQANKQQKPTAPKKKQPACNRSGPENRNKASTSQIQTEDRSEATLATGQVYAEERQPPANGQVQAEERQPPANGQVQAEERQPPANGQVIDDGAVQAGEEGQRPRGSRKRKSDPASWKKNIRKESLARGIPHVDSKGQQKAARTPKPSNCTTCRYKCNDNFRDAYREAICQEYWQLGDYSRQKDFLLSRVKVFGVQRQRVRAEQRTWERSSTMTYSFLKNGNETRVCKKFFLKTLDISHGCVRTALEHQGGSGTFLGNDKRGKKVPGNKTSEERVEAVKMHIRSFPTIESHYTRKDTHRLYLNQSLSIRTSPTEQATMRQLMQMGKMICTADGTDVSQSG